MTTLKVFTDGGSRGNPGPAAVGVFISDSNGCELAKISKQIGFATNNEAEYRAVITALEWIDRNFKAEEILANFYLDSTLAVNQLTGRFKIKNENLKKTIIVIKELERKINGKIYYHHIPREKNTVADSLVNSSYCK